MICEDKGGVILVPKKANIAGREVRWGIETGRSLLPEKANIAGHEAASTRPRPIAFGMRAFGICGFWL